MNKKHQALITGSLILAAAVAASWWWPLPAPRLLGAGPAVALVLLSFACGYVDASLGMGYGSTLTPLLLLLGFKPLDVIPAIVASQLAGGAAGSLAHHYVGNVDLHPGRRSFKVAAVLAVTSLAGAVFGALLASRVPELYLQVWVGVLVCGVGVATIALYGRHFQFSWKRIIALGVFAAFNKGTTGGGYGPVIMGGQLLAGVASKDAVGITTLAETLTCVTGTVTFVVASGGVRWPLAPFLIAGALAAVPFSALTVSVLKGHHLKIAVGVLTFALGALTLLKTFVF